MERWKPFAKTVSYRDKKVIWELYFNHLYSFDKLIERFNGKYTRPQIKSIISESYEEYGKGK